MNSKKSVPSIEDWLDEVVEDICIRIQAGEDIQLEQLTRQYPDMADRLTKLFPALLAMATFDPLATQLDSGTHEFEGGA